VVYLSGIPSFFIFPFICSLKPITGFSKYAVVFLHLGRHRLVARLFMRANSARKHNHPEFFTNQNGFKKEAISKDSLCFMRALSR